jgi:phenylalanyl-tRNA synthetase beta chain
MMVSISLADRGGRIYSSTVHYPYGRKRNSVTPVLQDRRVRLSLDFVRNILGIQLSSSEVARLLRKARFGASTTRTNSLNVVVPCYRLDVMHSVDIIEDIGIAYGLNRVKPQWPPHSTTGGITAQHEFRDLVREIVIGLGFQEVLTFALSNPDKLYTRMNIAPRNPVEVKNPRVQTLTCLRDWLIPSLMEILSANVHVTYPQRIFEVGDCVIRRDSQVDEPVRLASLSCHATASFAEARSSVDALLSVIGLECTIMEADHASFLQGRVATILIGNEPVGIVGEMHPQVLENWGIQNPAVGFELEVEPLRIASSNR